MTTEGTEGSFPFPVLAIDHSLYAVAEMSYVEVDQQADVAVARADVGEKLGVMDCIYAFYTLDLNDDLVFPNQIDAVA